jgi:FKBP-type peptidyl-prolyl cis-trans isomerase FkpA
MKYYFLLLLIPVIAFTSCSKPPQFSASKQAAIDDANIRAYIANNNIVAKDTLGVYYQIISPGTGARPTANSTVQVTYTGKMLDGTVFAPAGSTSSSSINSFIAGWQIGLPLIAPGGEILLLIPSGLAYGQGSPGYPITDNAVLVFDIKLNSFQ